ncbi:hypothetical protein FGB62_123g08 [Gracilaria domingensis]|nr:hypothetical protein FGB62_123g08 [Gracilaria domingensis]
MTNPAVVTDFIRTLVFFDTEPLLKVIAEREAKALAEEGITDPYEARRRMFAGSRYTKCPITVSTVQETLIPNALLAFVAAVFALSLFLSMVCLGTRRIRFAKLSDPLQWACRTFRKGEHQRILTSPVLRSEKSEEGIVFVVDDLKPVSEL